MLVIDIDCHFKIALRAKGHSLWQWTPETLRRGGIPPDVRRRCHRRATPPLARF
jgi:hypothetical protein